MPKWIRVIQAAPGTIKTKPRALNYALPFCSGEIIGVLDAEDAPEPDQLRSVVTKFSSVSTKTVGLQSRLDYYNPQSNWLARCFTMEYASWFRVMLPALAQIGFAIPLGGTTLYFRRSALVELGGWDAHNVTEDADLGIRLARAGYRCAMLDTTTFEEANNTPLSWVQQRSRWIKGYFMTYAAHMWSPKTLLHDLWIWQFCGFQVVFLRVSGGLFSGYTDVFACPCKLELLAHRFGACAARKLWGPCAGACRFNLPLRNRFYTRSADISHWCL